MSSRGQGGGERHGRFGTSSTLSLRGENEVKDAAIHGMQWTRSESAVRFPTHSGSPRAFSPRDDKMGGTTWAFGTSSTLSLRGENEVTDAAIHCMQ